MQRTIEVSHEGTHYPTQGQMRAALNAALKDEDVKVEGDVDYFLAENVSGGTSKVRATFTEAKPAAKPAAGKVKDDRTMTYGGKSD